ncbi:PepSY-like domain-containing protein [uncultured Bacteroides sp.]|uniref:PepSY-like domain-containing protein n=1 Tax=uncultured Bacteroides sp. TaxID=162156 RepID=UPI002AA8F451|nr:PepSY-like domain-containing protein [uncultured Bacteroides sp.]
MKKLALMIVAAMIASFSFAQKVQEKGIPANVENSLKKQYPNVTKVKWDKESGKYEATFKLNKVEQSVLIDANGKILETEVAIGVSQLPKNAISYLETHYHGKSIKDAAKITDAKGVVTYEAEIKGKDVIFDNNGKFIKEAKE